MKSLELIVQAIYDKKGFNILTLNIEHITSMASYLVIAEGHIDRHLQTIAKEVCDRLSTINIYPHHVEGKESGGWIVIDLQDILVHLFIPALRQKYQLEQLWQKAHIVEVEMH